MFHDVMARIKDFGAWKFFEELEKEHDEIFKFNHGFGLGVLRKPGGDPQEEAIFDLLFSGDEEVEKRLRQLYVHAGHYIEARRQVKRFGKQGLGKVKGKGGQGKQKPATDS